MEKASFKTIDFFPTEALGKSADILAGFFLSKTPVEKKEEFFRTAWAQAGFPAKLPLFLKQVHSGIVHTFDHANFPASAPPGDGIITHSKEAFIVIQVADCLPVLLFDPVKKRIAGAHAGWKGSLLGIAQTVARKLVHLGTNPSDLRIWFGPSIHACCYEVDIERSVLFPRRNGSERYIDLVSFNRRLLEEAGVKPQAIQVDSRCTACSAEKLPSYRREGKKAGRIFAFIALG